MEVAGSSSEEKRGRSEQKDQVEQAEKEEQSEDPTLETFVKIIQKKLQAEYYLGNQQKTRRPGRFAANTEAVRARTQTATRAPVHETKRERANIASHNLSKSTTIQPEPKKTSNQMTPSWLSRSMAAGTNLTSLREDAYENDDPFDNGQYCRQAN
ncbi:hypothetical protein WR25_04017 [Diploscapter pachys]|uniref:Uncharacterized protein n=1 Tax=Diploscapter pachys TaxID=2018661 RepID=A0A2A2KLX3_9BILA|nr:hypothetical protein WR25_04017 [Diploscapter pachys]